MSTAALDHEMNFQDNQQSEADKRLLVGFYKEVIKNQFKSIEAGRPIFDEVDHVRIITPGSRDSFVTKVSGPDTEYPLRFPVQWARYKAGQDQNVTGTPLNQLPWLSMAQVAEFNAVGCKTIEQLVGMPDNLSQKFMGHHQLKQKAQQYLDAANAAAPALQLQSELQKRDEQIAELKKMIEAMTASKKAENEAKVPLKA